MFTALKSALRGKKKLQGFFDTIHQYSLSGMNIGTGTEFTNSGEKFVLEFIYNELKIKAKSAVPLLFDVGANIGEYTLEANTIFNSNVTIHSFEPSKATFEKMIENFGNRKNLYGHQLALSDESGDITLYSNGTLSALASLNKRRLDHYNIAFEHSERVQKTTLDSFCLEHNIKEIDFLKIDVEGHELSVLHGARQLLQNKSITYIQFEFGGTNIDSRTFFQDFYYLLKDNYSLYRILSNGLQEIREYNERYEIFLASNFLAVKK
jgi:FkbM family methyltransferase